MKRTTEESRCEIAGNCDEQRQEWYQKMKAALEQRSAVMDGKTCGRRKSRKKCAEKTNHGTRKTEWAQEGGKEGVVRISSTHSRGAFI